MESLNGKGHDLHNDFHNFEKYYEDLKYHRWWFVG